MHNAILGLCAETGELANLWKKGLFQGECVTNKQLLDELGDVRWYLELALHNLDSNVTDLEESNVQKLRRRYPPIISKKV